VSDAVTNALEEKTVERRAIVGELRAKGRRLEGYAATFGAEARIGNFTETIAPGAFAASLAEQNDILALVDHDPGRVLARTRSGTLRLAEDSRGLAFDLDIPSTSNGSDVLALAERGDLGGASFAFTVKRDRWDGERRTLEAVDLHEVSIVSAWPAYNGTVVNARARPDLRGSNEIPLPPRVALARRYLETL
jgi:Escherichia/Staphylococcus phage prohead protease